MQYYNKMSDSLMDMVITTVGLILSLVLLSCLCCLCMKISDLRLKCYIIETAKKKGVSIDIDKLEAKSSRQLKDDTCTIMIPDVAMCV